VEALHQQAQAVQKVGLKVTEDVRDAVFAGTDAERDIRGQCLPDTVDPRGPKAKCEAGARKIDLDDLRRVRDGQRLGRQPPTAAVTVEQGDLGLVVAGHPDWWGRSPRPAT
jgi:hypothetical protein